MELGYRDSRSAARPETPSISARMAKKACWTLRRCGLSEALRQIVMVVPAMLGLQYAAMAETLSTSGMARGVAADPQLRSTTLPPIAVQAAERRPGAEGALRRRCRDHRSVDRDSEESVAPSRSVRGPVRDYRPHWSELWELFSGRRRTQLLDQ